MAGRAYTKKGIFFFRKGIYRDFRINLTNKSVQMSNFHLLRLKVYYKDRMAEMTKQEGKGVLGFVCLGCVCLTTQARLARVMGLQVSATTPDRKHTCT